MLADGNDSDSKPRKEDSSRSRGAAVFSLAASQSEEEKHTGREGAGADESQGLAQNKSSQDA